MDIPFDPKPRSSTTFTCVNARSRAQGAVRSGKRHEAIAERVERRIDGARPESASYQARMCQAPSRKETANDPAREVLVMGEHPERRAVAVDERGAATHGRKLLGGLSKSTWHLYSTK